MKDFKINEIILLMKDFKINEIILFDGTYLKVIEDPYTDGPNACKKCFFVDIYDVNTLCPKCNMINKKSVKFIKVDIKEIRKKKIGRLGNNN